mmetsp:Transcript_21207/g.44424  ORF Transcript_21207/g.44424 Transcript_21207/m.44424 type:complete len:527 (+) Transcript_21207:147-1727(+)
MARHWGVRFLVLAVAFALLLHELSLMQSLMVNPFNIDPLIDDVPGSTGFNKIPHPSAQNLTIPSTVRIVTDRVQAAKTPNSHVSVGLSSATVNITSSPKKETQNVVAHADPKISWFAKRLETFKGRRYYVYNHVNLTLPHIRNKSRDPNALPTWGQQKWAKRFRPYAQGELRFYEALEAYRGENLRTFDIAEADFVLVPIPLGAAIFWGDKADLEGAFGHLFNEPYFQQHPEKHLYITNNERLFRGDLKSMYHFAESGLTKHVVTKISRGILVKDFDAQFFRQYLMKFPKNNDWNAEENFWHWLPSFSHHWSLGYSHESSDPQYNLTLATFDNWSNKELNFFYRTTKGKSQNNSTNYRHAIFQSDMAEVDRLIQPSAVGYEVGKKRWLREISSSKYCIVVRGDNPSSRSMFVAIRLGCIPVIVSDALPYYQPVIRSLLRYDDFSILINEAQFLSNPAETLNNAILSLSDDELKQKIDGLALVQRILSLDHPSPLFVPAFVHETVARQRDNPMQFLLGRSFAFGGGG